MPKDRSTVLTDALKVSPSEVRWHFIADYYDGPIAGLAFFRDRLYRCCCFREDVPDHHIYVLQELTAEELAEELRVKAKFEAMCGTHNSFDEEGEPLPHAVQSEASCKRYAEEEKYVDPDPWDRAVFAWFDTASGDQGSA